MPSPVRFLTALTLLCLFPAVNGMAAVWHVCVMDRTELPIPCCPTQQAHERHAQGEHVSQSPHAAEPCCCASLEAGFLDPALSALEQAVHVPQVGLSADNIVIPHVTPSAKTAYLLRDSRPFTHSCAFLCTLRI